MIIETTKDEYIIRFPISSSMKDMQDVIDYFRYKELTSGFHTEQSEVDEIAREINKNRWNGNKNKFPRRIWKNHFIKSGMIGRINLS
jgi:hypothetical protein